MDSLKTGVFSVAKQRLSETVREHRAKLESVTAFSNGKMTVGDAAQAIWARSKRAFRLSRGEGLPRDDDRVHRPIVACADEHRRSQSQRGRLRKLAHADQRQYAPTVVNNGTGTLRSVFDEAIRTGARFNNPAAGLPRVKVRAKRLELPSREEFLKFVEEIRTAGARQSRDCSNLVKFVAYSGVRIGEARFVALADANLGRRELHVRADPQTTTKNGKMRYVPMIPELEEMLTQLRAARSEEPASTTIHASF